MANKNGAAAGLVCRLMVVMLGAAMMTLRISADPDMLQDVCVADFNSRLKINGYACKSKAPTWNDFYYNGLSNPAKPGPNSTVVTLANVEQIPGLNTMGVSMGRVEYAPTSSNPPHSHPRATEMVYVVDGTLDVGFITTANVFVSKTLKKGDVFVFPKGLLHYQRNVAKSPASAIVAFSSQLPGRQSIPASLFAAKPPVPDAVLADAFMIDTTMVQSIKKKFLQTKK